MLEPVLAAIVTELYHPTNADLVAGTSSVFNCYHETFKKLFLSSKMGNKFIEVTIGFVLPELQSLISLLMKVVCKQYFHQMIKFKWYTLGIQIVILIIRKYTIKSYIPPSKPEREKYTHKLIHLTGPEVIKHFK